MCKRAIEAYRSEPSRCKKPQLYTQGPLDLVFGQHRAFPEPGSHPDLPVWDYLAGVRKEAENDKVCHFVERSDDSRRPMAVEVVKTDGGRILKEYIDSVLKELKHKKEEYAESTTSLEVKEGVTISVDDLDFSAVYDEDDGLEERNETEAEQGVEEQRREDEDEGFETEERQSSDSQEQSAMESSTDRKDAAKHIHESDLPAVPESAAKWRQLIFSTPPPPIDYFHDVLEHPTVIKLIVFYTKWLLATMPCTVQEWMFTTFVRLDNGLDHREMAIVRDLGRKAQKLRLKAVAANVPHNPAYDMVLAVVGEYYGQKDLLE